MIWMDGDGVDYITVLFRVRYVSFGCVFSFVIRFQAGQAVGTLPSRSSTGLEVTGMPLSTSGTD
jgi:hypothetical protein